ncbi:MAG: hypothetical protein K8R75_00110 [Deltaproteobacteria bacterium]|nr:hypothetical protein [Deltaproteobacteria bacterium]
MRGGGYADVLPVLQVPDNKADAVPCERLLIFFGPVGDTCCFIHMDSQQRKRFFSVLVPGLVFVVGSGREAELFYKGVPCVVNISLICKFLKSSIAETGNRPIGFTLTVAVADLEADIGIYGKAPGGHTPGVHQTTDVFAFQEIAEFYGIRIPIRAGHAKGAPAKIPD